MKSTKNTLFIVTKLIVAIFAFCANKNNGNDSNLVRRLRLDVSYVDEIE